MFQTESWEFYLSKAVECLCIIYQCTEKDIQLKERETRELYLLYLRVFWQALVVQLGPKECVVATGDLGGDSGKLKQVLDRSGLMVTERKKSEWFTVDVTWDTTAPAELL